jgi:hypothetical protein
MKRCAHCGIPMPNVKADRKFCCPAHRAADFRARHPERRNYERKWKNFQKLLEFAEMALELKKSEKGFDNAEQCSMAGGDGQTVT